MGVETAACFTPMSAEVFSNSLSSSKLILEPVGDVTQFGSIFAGHFGLPIAPAKALDGFVYPNVS